VTAHLGSRQSGWRCCCENVSEKLARCRGGIDRDFTRSSLSLAIFHSRIAICFFHVWDRRSSFETTTLAQPLSDSGFPFHGFDGRDERNMDHNGPVLLTRSSPPAFTFAYVTKLIASAPSMKLSFRESCNRRLNRLGGPIQITTIALAFRRIHSGRSLFYSSSSRITPRVWPMR